MGKQYEKGASLRMLAKEHNRSVEGIRKILLREGIVMRSRSQNQRDPQVRIDSIKKHV